MLRVTPATSAFFNKQPLTYKILMFVMLGLEFLVRFLLIIQLKAILYSRNPVDTLICTKCNWRTEAYRSNSLSTNTWIASRKVRL